MIAPVDDSLTQLFHILDHIKHASANQPIEPCHFLCLVQLLAPVETTFIASCMFNRLLVK
jgi:hypothetical protein